MYEVRQIIQQLRLGGSQRQIARSQHVSRKTVATIEGIATEHGWLDPTAPIPEDEQLAAYFKSSSKAPQNVSSVEVFREEILTWHTQGINATTIRQSASPYHERHWP